MHKFPPFLLTGLDLVINEMAAEPAVILIVLTQAIITKVTTLSNHISGSALLLFKCTALLNSQ